MELTPQTLHAVEFREARRGGYNTRDVDDFLERVAVGVANLHDRLREIASRAEAAEARLLDAQHQMDELQRRPPAASSPIMAPAAPPAPSVNDADDTLRRTLVLAQRTADATIKEAKQEANRLLGEARDEAARTRAAAEDEARRGADHARLSAEAEIDELIGEREALKSDIDALGTRVASLDEAPETPPSQPMPFPRPDEARGPWLPSELRTSPGDEPPPPLPRRGAGPNGAPPVPGGPGDAGGRPSEWGRSVFDTEVPEGPEVPETP